MSDQRRDYRKLFAVVLDIVIIVGVVLGLNNPRVDRYSLLALAGVALIVFNGMFLLIRATERTLPKERLRVINRYVLWPFLVLAGLVFVLNLVLKH